MSINFGHLIQSVPIWSGVSYLARTFPMPTNKYFKWILGGVQYVLANPDLGSHNFRSAKIDQQFDDLKDKIDEVNKKP